MNLFTFQETRKMLIDQTEIAAFMEKVGSDYDPAFPVAAVYVYGDTFYVTEDERGIYWVLIGSYSKEFLDIDSAVAELFEYAQDEM